MNPNYKGEETPQNYRDWLDLIYESIHHPDNPDVNIKNEGIKRATELMNYENISPDEWEQSKIEVGKRKVLTLEREQGKIDVAINMLAENEPYEKIIKYTGLTLEQIYELEKEQNE